MTAVHKPKREASGGASPARPCVSASSFQNGRKKCLKCCVSCCLWDFIISAEPNWFSVMTNERRLQIHVTVTSFIHLVGTIIGL